jgi:hypothetical protein
VFAEGADELGRKYCGRRAPVITKDTQDEVILQMPVEAMLWKAVELPSYDERRAILAKDALASADGFRLLVSLTYEHLFGMRVCGFCPDCNNGEHGRPCQDLFGSSANPEGGIFGRIDAGYTSIEAQKSTGSLHAHSQLFVQCLHQHMPLEEIFRHVRNRGDGLVQEYLKYKAHVARQIYADCSEEAAERLQAVEKEWPEFKGEHKLCSRPSYQSRKPKENANAKQLDEDAKQWYKEFIADDVQYLQQHKQHHVHLLNEETGEREPLTACRRKDNPKLCKADYPRTKWLWNCAVVLCHGLIKEMDMALTGRRSKLGGLHGPVNHEYLNATHPAMLGVHRFNSDVQLPYRFPISCMTCYCGQNCGDGADDGDIIRAAQVAQDAQAGYACDYCNKRQPMAFNEVKECCKGHQELSSRLAGESVSYMGKRHATRLMSDAYGKGIVRGQVENTNLRAYHKDNAVTFSETFRTCQTEAFFGREYVDVVQLLNDKRPPGKRAIFAEIDARNKKKKKVTFRDVATLYGQRPQDDRVWHLSPYEFVTYWEPLLLSYPQTLADAEDPKHHARLTEAGRQKLTAAGRWQLEVDLKPGEDYVVKEEQEKGQTWIAFPDVPDAEHFVMCGSCSVVVGRGRHLLQARRFHGIAPAKVSARRRSLWRIFIHGRCAPRTQTSTCHTQAPSAKATRLGSSLCSSGWMEESCAKKRNVTSATFWRCTACGHKTTTPTTPTAMTL